MPQVIVNKAKWKEGIEGLELFRKLAKQVLSQLSYTPSLFQPIVILPRCGCFRLTTLSFLGGTTGTTSVGNEPKPTRSASASRAGRSSVGVARLHSMIT